MEDRDSTARPEKPSLHSVPGGEKSASKAFIERMKSDRTFREEVLAETDVDARLRFIRAAGFDLTADEIEPPSGALADDELDAVTGGLLWNPSRGDGLVESP